MSTALHFAAALIVAAILPFALVAWLDIAATIIGALAP